MEAVRSKSYIAIPPGVTIREQLEDRKMTQSEFATRMDMSEKHINQLINGKVELTANAAARLESVLGVPASFWSSMEAAYRAALIRVTEENDMEADKKIAQKMPYTEAARLGWIAPASSLSDKVINLRKYFEVARLKALSSLKIPGINYRKQEGSEKSDYALAVWAQKARLVARSRENPSPINIAKLKHELPNIKRLSQQSAPDFIKTLSSILAECGIALVILPHLKGSKLNGATFPDSKHIVLGLTARGKYADKFWFSLYHEFYHILNGDIFSVAPDNETDIAAEAFARDSLISPEDYRGFVNGNDFSKEAVLAFSKFHSLSPSVLVGRLQYDNHIHYNKLNELKEQYALNDLT